MAKVMIGIPIRQLYGSPSYKTQNCIARLRQSTGHATELFTATGQQITQNSLTICEDFLEHGWDYLLYTGDDIVFPPDALDRLIAHDKDFVSGVCTWKSPPYMVPAGRMHEGKFKHILLRPEHVQNRVLMEVDGVGSGFILVKRRVIEAIHEFLREKVYPSIPTEYRWMSPMPFFPVTFDPDKNEVMSSDYSFARLARQCGFQIHLDCSLICRHRWEGEYDIEDHWAWVDKYGFTRQEEAHFGDNPGYTPVDENSIYWGPQGPPVQITMTSTGNLYHLHEHVGPALGGFFEPIETEGAARTEAGYVIGFHVGDDDSWHKYSAWCNRFKKVLIQWVGSDITNIDSWMTEKRLVHLNHPRFVHLVEDERLLPEVRKYFENVHVSSMPTALMLEPVDLPEKFAVAVYYPQHRHDFHYGDVLKEVIEKMPDVQFHLYHLFGKKPEFEYPNALWLGNLKAPEYVGMLGMSSCMLRLSQHDGRPYSIVEAAMMGRRFITNFDMEGTERVPDVPKATDVIKAIKKIRMMAEPDKVVAEHYARENSHLLFKDRIRGFVTGQREGNKEYKYIDYWDQRHSACVGDSCVQDKELEKWANEKITAAIKDNDCETVLDVGCGSMRRWKQLPVQPCGYTGMDVSPKAVKQAQSAFPESTFFVGDLTTEAIPGADAVVALQVLPHIKPEHFQQVIKKIFDAAKKLVVLTLTFDTGDGFYQHDLPRPEKWDVGEWKMRMMDAPGDTPIKLLVFEWQEEALGVPA